jgi:tRNA (uracil-5-)-methyltransferase TRM9
VNSATAAQLLQINRRFYLEHGPDFSDTRRRVQPGVRRVLESVRTEDTVLDLGCGNGSLARALSQKGHRGRYFGIDFSPALLEGARSGPYPFPTEFLQVDLTSPRDLRKAVETVNVETPAGQAEEAAKGWDVITAFAVLHHIPGRSLRLQLFEQARFWLLPRGRLILSNWRFSNSARMQLHILPWSAADVMPDEVDEGDYLIDWRRGTAGVRYVHEFSEGELAGLAQESGFKVVQSFVSDGVDRRSGLYQLWQRA